MSDRTLIVLRHAKTEPSNISDFARRLLPRGIADAADVGRWLAQHDFTPDVVLVSPAVRAQQTATAVVAAAGWDVPPTTVEDLYGAGAYDVIALVGGMDDEVGTVLVIGHNPTMAGVIALLKDDTDEDALPPHLPTSGLAVLTWSGSWDDGTPGSAQLESSYTGRSGS